MKDCASDNDNVCLYCRSQKLDLLRLYQMVTAAFKFDF